MATTNNERVGKALDLLRDGLAPFIEREFRTRFGAAALERAQHQVAADRLNVDRPLVEWDVAALLALMWNAWNEVFRDVLGQAERTYVSELRGFRNDWAHQRPFSGDDAYRALDTVTRLLTAISAPQADEVERMKMELLRVRFDEQARSDRRRAGTAIESQATGTLKPWREVVHPHRDVASGQYQQAEFAADLWQVHIGEGSPEYRDPVEFFRRTYLTQSLRDLLAGSVKRLAGSGGDPVVQLQTNFGGGKTHSMLALYHLFGGTPATELPGADEVLRAAGLDSLPRASRVVIVGNRISPGNPVTKPDGTLVRTLWGELAWQLGFARGGDAEARRAFERIRADDERATSPGDTLRELLNDYGPALVLIDEWVAYARQLHDQGDLPGGTFETHFTFAQALTESAKLARQCLLVISLPASDTSGSPHALADDVEVGGERGRAALDRLRNAVGRVEASWRPASAEEGFEIVRRRLFEPITERAQFTARDGVARAFFDLYRTQAAEFPPEAHDPAYEKRIRDAYPIHPEVFDRLYTDWSTLVKFQRTRGVLRLMAAVIHSLWEKGDRNPLIMPANIPIDDPRVQFELTRYLSDNWVPVIEKDVDGPAALPARIDSEVPNLGRYAATRRVARTVYLGSAPTAGVANRGLEDRRVRLGCVMPEESPAIFGDALRRLAASATYLYQDGPRYWYSTQPTVTKLADDLAEQLRREPDKVVAEIDRRVREDVLRQPGLFGRRVHPLPAGDQDVADDQAARLVVLGPGHPYSKEAGSRAEEAARAILASRGVAPRLYQNTLVFLAVDAARLQDLDEAVRRYLAWKSVVEQRESLDLSPHQLRQAETQLSAASGTVAARLPEAYQWLLVPVQDTPQAPVRIEAYRLAGTEPLAVRASKRLRSEELLLTGFAGTRLRMELDRVPLWRGDHVSVAQLADDFARYVYLPRLAGPDVLVEAVRDGLGLLLWQQEGFAYADSYDEAAGRYRGLRGGQLVPITEDDMSGLLVRPEVAQAQFERERPAGTADSAVAESSVGVGGVVGGAGGGVRLPVPPPGPAAPTRYHGTVRLDPGRVGRDAGRIADEVIAHLVGLVGADVTVTLEIEASIPGGAPEQVVRIVTQNGRDLKFTSGGFETE